MTPISVTPRIQSTGIVLALPSKFTRNRPPISYSFVATLSEPPSRHHLPPALASRWGPLASCRPRGFLCLLPATTAALPPTWPSHSLTLTCPAVLSPNPPSFLPSLPAFFLFLSLQSACRFKTDHIHDSLPPFTVHCLSPARLPPTARELHVGGGPFLLLVHESQMPGAEVGTLQGLGAHLSNE